MHQKRRQTEFPVPKQVCSGRPINSMDESFMKLAMCSFIAGNTSRIVHVANLAHCHQRIFLSDIEVKLHHSRFGVIPLIRIKRVVLMAASHSESAAGTGGSMLFRVEACGVT